MGVDEDGSMDSNGMGGMHGFRGDDLSDIFMRFGAFNGGGAGAGFGGGSSRGFSFHSGGPGSQFSF